MSSTKIFGKFSIGFGGFVRTGGKCGSRPANTGYTSDYRHNTKHHNGNRCKWGNDCPCQHFWMTRELTQTIRSEC